MSKLRSFIVLFSLVILVSPKAYAAYTTLKATAENLTAIPEQEFIVDLSLCGEGTTSVDAFFDLGESTSEFSAEISVDSDVIPITVKKEYDNEAKTVQITGGNSGGIVMGEDGCVILGNLTIIATTAGTIVITPDFEESQALGGDPIDPAEEVDALEITVTSTTAADTTDETDTTETIDPTVTTDPAEETDHEAATTSLLPPTNIQVETTSGSAKITWEATDAQIYKIFYAKKSDYDVDNANLSTADILGNQTTSYTIPTLDAETKYLFYMTSTAADGIESAKSENMTFTTTAVPIDTTEPITISAETLPEVHDAATVAPQPTAYIVQDPQQQSFAHTDTGPEHIIIGLVSFVLIGWVYLRKKLA
jgi:hypothetical protein